MLQRIKYYKVENGDTLKEISERVGIPIEELILNNKSNVVKEGDVLFFDNSNIKTYVVKPADTYYSISKKLGLDESELRQKNTQQIFIGQVLNL